MGSGLSELPETERLGKVIFVITTDGLENASCEFDKKTVKEMVEYQQSKYSWICMFLGADMDAVKEAASYGVNVDFARTWTGSHEGTQILYQSMNKALSNARKKDFNVNDSASKSYQATMVALDEIEEK